MLRGPLHKLLLEIRAECRVADSKASPTTSHSVVSLAQTPLGHSFGVIPASIRKIILRERARFGDQRRVHEIRFQVGSAATCSNRWITLHWYDPKQDSPPRRALANVIAWMRVAARAARCECASVGVHVFMFLLDVPKRLPYASSLALGAEQVNTAFTTACSRGSAEIHLFRREEWFKVLIHESVHCFGLDFASAPASAMRAGDVQLRRAFLLHASQPRELTFEEAYTETVAVLILCMFVACSQARHHSSCWSEWRKMVAREQQWSVVQAVKVLRYAGVHYGGDMHAYRERTPVFAYYVLKSVLLCFYQDMEKVMWGGAGGTVLRAPEPQSVWRFILSHMHDRGFLAHVGAAETSDESCSPTLRMTLHA